MSVFIELTTLDYDAVFKQRASFTRAGGNRTAGAGKQVARRPTRGIEIKEDTYANIKVVQADGRELPLFDSSSASGLSVDGYSNFIIQTAQEARMEKHQIIETFGASYVYFFGESPRFLDYQAILLNTNDFNWHAEWWENYERYMRGSKLTEMGARLYLFYEDLVVEGYMLNAQAVLSAMDPYKVALTFRLYVTNYRNISFVEAPDNASFPIRGSVELPEGVDLTESGSADRIVSYYRGDAYTANRSMSDIVRSVPRSIGVANSFFDTLAQDPTADANVVQEQLILRQGQPIRGLIADNTDEYTGMPTDQTDLGFTDPATGIPSAYQGTVRSSQEVEDLFRTAIEALSCYGANINSPDALSDLGMAPSFYSSPTGSFGASADAYASVSGGGYVDAYAGASAGGTFGASASASGSANGLASVYGRASAGASFGGSATYGGGYTSDFSGGTPGFGLPGYGDAGGYGYGSSLGAGGDPGYKDPSRFTFAGVADAGGAWERFNRPKADNTVYGNGLAGGSTGTFGTTGSAYAGASTGASVSVGGAVTAFALVSVDGTLDPSGLARQLPDPNTKFGFSNDNPYGVACAARADELSDGGSYSFSETF